MQDHWTPEAIRQRDELVGAIESLLQKYMEKAELFGQEAERIAWYRPDGAGRSQAFYLADTTIEIADALAKLNEVVMHDENDEVRAGQAERRDSLIDTILESMLAIVGD